MTNDGFNGYTYDAEGNVLTVGGNAAATYVYDAMNHRTWVQTNGTTYEYTFDTAGRRVSSWPQTVNIANEGRIYWDGQPLAYRSNDGSTYFQHENYLGTERLRTNSAGAVAATFTSLAWGDGYAADIVDNGANQDIVHFAGLDQDGNPGTDIVADHAQFRDYSFVQGRWLSPDPYDGSYDLTNPQSLNRYAYALNNPLGLTDPTGLDCAYLNAAGTGLEKGGLDQSSSANQCGSTGGYWVDGGLTSINVDADQGSVQLTGTTNGEDQTHASYQDTTVFIGMYQNSAMNPFGHIAIGLTGQTPVGLNPTSDIDFLLYATYGGKGGGVHGVVKPQVPKGLKKSVLISITGMQAQMIQNELNSAMQSSPNYDIFGGGPPACDCAGFAQWMLGGAGINSGPPTDIPSTLMQQLSNQYPQQ